MSFYCSYNLRQQLNAATDKLNWCSIISATLGNTRRIRCKRDPNASAVDPWATGTEFRNVGSTGPMGITAGVFTDFGAIKGTTVSQAADLTTGRSVLRIEGNGEWIIGSLGLSRAAQTAAGIPTASQVDYDFTVDSNFTANNGIAIAMGHFTLSGDHLLPSGTGPHAPALDADAPARVKIWDWTDPANPVLAGTIPFDTRRDDFVFEDAEMAAEMGDIGVYQSSQVATLTDINFGATLLVGTRTNGESLSKTHYQVFIYAAPNTSVQGWGTYPFADTYALKTNNTIPKPFKATIEKADGTVLYTHQMRDALPINSPQLSQAWTPDAELRPFWAIDQWLPWESEKASVSIHQKKRFNGMDSGILRPKIARWRDSVNAVNPYVYASSNWDGDMHMWALAKWPLRDVQSTNDAAYLASADADISNGTDPYLFNMGNGLGYNTAWRSVGWGYEPGAFGGQDRYCSPGGPRFDRACVPSLLSLWTTQKDFKRPKGNVPIADMVYDWGRSYFNQGGHWVTNLNTCASVPVQNTVNAQYAINWGYYSMRAESDQRGLANVVEISTVRNSSSFDPTINANGNGIRPFSAWSPDDEHAYNCAGLWSTMFNSPMHAVLGKFRFLNSIFAQIGENYLYKPAINYYMQRIGAWRFLHYTVAWKNASRHDLGIQRSVIENRLQLELEKIHDEIYVPCIVNNDMTPYLRLMRVMGVQAGFSNGAMQGGASGLGYYYTHMFALMRQYGLFDVMIAKSTKCHDALKFTLRNFAMGSVDRILDAQMRGGGYPTWTTGTYADEGSIPDSAFPTSWADWGTRLFPRNGQESVITDPSGNVLPGSYEPEVNVHWVMQWPSMHLRYFPEAEYSYPRLQEAADQCTAWDAAVAAKAAQPDNGTFYNTDWHYRYPSQGYIAAPGASDPARQ